MSGDGAAGRNARADQAAGLAEQSAVPSYALPSGPFDLGAVLPLIEPYRVPRTYAPPAGARAVWRLRGWELSLLPGGQDPGRSVERFLANNAIDMRWVVFGEDITVWKFPDGRKEIGWMHKDYRERKDGSFRRVARPMYTPLVSLPPKLVRKRFRAFDRLRAMFQAGHWGQSLGTDLFDVLGPFCPACSHERGELVPFLCPPVKRLMPGWLRDFWESYIAERVREAREEERKERVARRVPAISGRRGSDAISAAGDQLTSTLESGT
jgi:hypothetical protein